MAARLTASVGSADALVANLFAADRRMQVGARRVVKRNGERQFELTRKYAPVLSGFLKSKIILRISDDGLAYGIGFRRADFAGEGKAPYFFFVWHGTRFMAANPFPDRARADVYPRFKTELETEVKGAMRRRSR
jgi:hypothetical protein